MIKKTWLIGILWAAHSAAAGSISIGWEITNTVAIRQDASGIRTAIRTIPVTQNIILTGIQYNFSQCPSPGWPNAPGTAQTWVGIFVAGSSSYPFSVSLGQNVDSRYEVVGIGGSEWVADFIVKTNYPEDATLSPSYTPLNIPVYAGQAITMIMAYASATVASDIELQGNIQYQPMQ